MISRMMMRRRMMMMMMVMMMMIMMITFIMIIYILILLAIFIVLMMLLVSDDVFWQTQGFWIVSLQYDTYTSFCLFYAGRQAGKEIASSQAVIAKEKDLQKAFGTVELPEPLDSSSWSAGSPSGSECDLIWPHWTNSYSEGEAIPHLTKNSGWVNSCPMNKPDQYVKCGERVP